MLQRFAEVAGMTDADAAETADRVPLNLRVDATVLRRFNERVIEKYGHRQPYAAVELERELRHVLDDGAVSRLWRVADELLSTLGIPTGGKNSLREFDRDGAETTVLRYKIDADLRDDLVAAADERDTSAGELVETTMQRYYDSARGSVVERVVDRLERATTVGGELDTDKSATERRRDTIAAAVAGDDRTGFTLAEFDDAVDDHVHGLSSSSYARDEHLEPVLERIEYTWHPNNSDIFVPREEFDLPADDGDRDPRGRPAVLTDNDHMTVAAAVEAAERALNNGQPYRLTLGEAAGVVGKPDYNGLKGAFRRAAGRFAGLKPREKDGSFALAANPSDIREAADDDLLRHVDIDDNDAGDAEPTWVDDAADRFPADAPESVLTNCIARAKHNGDPPTERDDWGQEAGIASEVLDAVTDEERELVRERLADDDADDEVEEEMNRVEEAERPNADDTDADSDGRAVADGGTVVAEDE